MGDTETPNVYPVVPPVGNIPTSRKQIYNTVMNFSSLQIGIETSDIKENLYTIFKQYRLHLWRIFTYADSFMSYVRDVW